MCLFESRFSQGICPVVELLGHMVVFKRCLCQQFRDGRSTRQEERGSDAGGKLQIYTREWMYGDRDSGVERRGPAFSGGWKAGAPVYAKAPRCSGTSRHQALEGGASVTSCGSEQREPGQLLT